MLGSLRLAASPRSGRRSSPARRSTALLNAQRIDTVIVTGLHDLGLRPRDDRRRVLERLPHARPRGRRRRPGAGPARREPARLPAPLRRGHDDGRLHRVPAAPRRRMRRPPLEDVTIIAIEQYGAGPWGSVHLADLGADVIKIEDPRSRGDVGRYVPPFQEGEDSLFFETFCHNKRSVSLDLTHPEARAGLRGSRARRRRRLQQPARRRAREAAHPLRRPRERQSGHRVLLAHGLRHDGAARGRGRLRLHPAGLRGLDVADRRARRPARPRPGSRSSTWRPATPRRSR